MSRADKLAQFEVDGVEEFRPRWNVAPSQQIATIRANDGKRILSPMRWGLVPHWAKDLTIGYKLINARSETVLEKPSFREAFKKRRCLIPADGFYEWKKVGAGKQPFNFSMKDDAIFAFAGIWETWNSPEGKLVESCSILTTTPNELVADVHDRMPVILHSNSYNAWLSMPAEQAKELTDLLVPYDSASMQCYPVSMIVNTPKNDRAECLERVAAVGA